MYEFFWSEFADWYLEIAKLQVAEGGDRAANTAARSWRTRIGHFALRLLHPIHTLSSPRSCGGYLKGRLLGAKDWGEALDRGQLADARIRRKTGRRKAVNSFQHW